MVTVYVPTVVAVPDKAPLTDSKIPAGEAPEVTAYVRGSLPPEPGSV